MRNVAPGPSLERTDCWCRSNFSIKGQDIRHRSRSFERLRCYPPVLAALPALSALCLQLQHEPCPCMSLHMHAIPTWRIRVKGCCVDRLSPPPDSDQNRNGAARRISSPNAEDELSPASENGRRRDEPMPNSTVIKLYREAVRGIHGSFIPVLRPNVARIIYPRSRRLTNFIDEIEIPKVLSNKSQAWPLAVLNTLILT